LDFLSRSLLLLLLELSSGLLDLGLILNSLGNSILEDLLLILVHARDEVLIELLVAVLELVESISNVENVINGLQLAFIEVVVVVGLFLVVIVIVLIFIALNVQVHHLLIVTDRFSLQLIFDGFFLLLLLLLELFDGDLNGLVAEEDHCLHQLRIEGLDGRRQLSGVRSDDRGQPQDESLHLKVIGEARHLGHESSHALLSDVVLLQLAQGEGC